MFEARAVQYANLMRTHIPLYKRIWNHAHRDQKYGTGDYVSNHVIPVMFRAMRATEENGLTHVVSLTDIAIVAALHDSIEDGPEDTFDLVIEELELINKCYLSDSILLLTRSSVMTYEEYINRITDSGDPVALIVKYADMDLNNFHSYRNTRYERFLPILHEKVENLKEKSE